MPTPFDVYLKQSSIVAELRDLLGDEECAVCIKPEHADTLTICKDDDRFTVAAVTISRGEQGTETVLTRMPSTIANALAHAGAVMYRPNEAYSLGWLRLVRRGKYINILR